MEYFHIPYRKLILNVIHNMNVKFSIKNNKCYFDNNGSIKIVNILYDSDEEQKKYHKYIINWTGDFCQKSKITNNGRHAFDLKNGNYQFEIISLINSEYTSGPYEVSITSPEQIQIIKADHSYNDKTKHQIKIECTGGEPPYIYYCNSQYIISKNNNVVFNNLISSEYQVYVIDSNNCKALYKNNITINGGPPKIVYTKTIEPPIFNGYVDLEIKVLGRSGPFIVSLQNKNTNENINIDSNHITKKDHYTYTYSIKNIASPGSYLLIIVGQNGETIKKDIDLDYKSAYQININSFPNTHKESNIFYETEFIYNTILFPYHIIKDNINIWNILNSSSINLYIKERKNEYQKLSKSINIVNLPIIKFGSDTKDWFFYFYIYPGIRADNINRNNTNELHIKDDNQNKWPVTLGLDNMTIDKQNISLIRGSMILLGGSYQDIIPNKNIYILPNNNEVPNFIYQINPFNKMSLKNAYNIGISTNINFLENFIHNSLEDYEEIKNLLCYINNPNNIYSLYTTKNINYNGSIYISFTTNILNYTIELYHYNHQTQKLNLVNTQNTHYTKNSIYLKDLAEEDLILIKARDYKGCHPTTILHNNITFKYKEYFEHIKEILKNNSIILNIFKYGDLIVSPKFNQIHTNINNIIDSNKSDNFLNITCSRNDIKYYIKGPNNYCETYLGNTSLRNLAHGVYNISLDQEDCDKNNIYHFNKNILISNNQKSLYLEFLPNI
jgi:hypothetical protein